MQNMLSPNTSQDGKLQPSCNKNESNLFKKEQAASTGGALISLLASTNQNTQRMTDRETSREKNMKKFKQKLLNVEGQEQMRNGLAQIKGSPVNNSPGLQYKGLKYGKSLSVMSVKSHYSSTPSSFVGHAPGEGLMTKMKMRKVMKTLQGTIIDKVSSELNLPSRENPMYASLYNSDYHKNFIRNSRLIALKAKDDNQRQLFSSSKILESPSFYGIQQGQQQQGPRDGQLGRKRTNTNHILEKEILDPSEIPERSKSINFNGKSGRNDQEQDNKIVREDKKLIKIAEQKQKNTEDVRIKDAKTEGDKQQKDDFESLLLDVRSDKFNTINDEDVLSEYQQSQFFGSEGNFAHPLTPEQEALQQLLLSQPQYFDHKAGNCICKLCSCGDCQIKCRKISENLERNFKQSWISSYRQSFYPKSQTSGKINALETITPQKLEYKGTVGSCAELFSTTQKSDFKPKELLTDLYRFKPKQYEENNMPFSRLSTYSTNYINWGTGNFEKVRGSQDRTVLENLPFSSLTTYEQSYHKEHKLTPTMNLKPKDQNPLPNIGLFLGDSSYKTSTNKISSLYEKPPKRQPTPPNIIPGYEGQFKSETTKAYQGHVDKCLGREFLRKQYLEKLQQVQKLQPQRPLTLS